MAIAEERIDMNPNALTIGGRTPTNPAPPILPVPSPRADRPGNDRRQRGHPGAWRGEADPYSPPAGRLGAPRHGVARPDAGLGPVVDIDTAIDDRVAGLLAKVDAEPEAMFANVLVEGVEGAPNPIDDDQTPKPSLSKAGREKIKTEGMTIAEFAAWAGVDRRTLSQHLVVVAPGPPPPVPVGKIPARQVGNVVRIFAQDFLGGAMSSGDSNGHAHPQAASSSTRPSRDWARQIARVCRRGA